MAPPVLKPPCVGWGVRIYVSRKRKIIHADALTEQAGAGYAGVCHDNLFQTNCAPIRTAEFLGQFTARYMIFACCTRVRPNHCISCDKPNP